MGILYFVQHLSYGFVLQIHGINIILRESGEFYVGKNIVYRHWCDGQEHGKQFIEKRL